MPTPYHQLVAAMADDPVVEAAGGLTPTRWNQGHVVLNTVSTKNGVTYAMEGDAQGRILDDVLVCTGTVVINTREAQGSGRSCRIVCGTGITSVTINRAGSDTIGGLTSFVMTNVGDSCVICDDAVGKWTLLAAKGATSTDITPGALATAGTSLLKASADHTHRGAGAIAVVTSEVSVSNTNAETTILTATLPTGLLTATTVFRFKFYGTVQLQATSGALTFRMYIGANAGQTVQLASVTSAQARVGCAFDGMAGMRTSGASGTFIANGEFYLYTSATAMRDAIQGAETTTTVDTTASTPVVKLTAQFATQSATNILRVQNGLIEIVNP